MHNLWLISENSVVKSLLTLLYYLQTFSVWSPLIQFNNFCIIIWCKQNLNINSVYISQIYNICMYKNLLLNFCQNFCVISAEYVLNLCQINIITTDKTDKSNHRLLNKSATHFLPICGKYCKGPLLCLPRSLRRYLLPHSVNKGASANRAKNSL